MKYQALEGIELEKAISLNEEIGTNLNALVDTLDDMIVSDADSVLKLAYTARVAASVIGWMSDKLAGNLDGTKKPTISTAENWFLSPHYLDLCKKARKRKEQASD